MSDSGRYEVRTDDAPKALGPYNQAIVLQRQRLVFVSGQIGIDPDTGEMAAGGVKGQTIQCVKNIERILGAAGGDRFSVVKTTIFLADLEDFPAMNDAYAEAVGAPYPARSCIGGCDLPKGALVEIEAIAALGD
jgi:2-iminobutanoate/2-iminopropanoate deaminase